MIDSTPVQFEGCKLYLLKNDLGISQALHTEQGRKNREKGFMDLIRKFVKPGDVCMDIGANIGFVTLLIAKLVGPKGKVYAVEPDEQNFKILKKNIEANNFQDRVEIDCRAISNVDGKALFYHSPKLQSNLGSLSKKSGVKPISVPTSSLDSYLKGKDLPDFYKMDVEGNEVKILNGMHQAAGRSKIGTKLLIEIHSKEYGKNLNMEAALHAFVKLGFVFKYMISAGLARPKLFREKGYIPIKTYKCGARWERGLYEKVKTRDAIRFCSFPYKEFIPKIRRTTWKAVRSIMLEKVK